MKSVLVVALVAYSALACDQSWYTYPVSCTSNSGCSFNGAYVPAVDTPVSAYIIVYPSSITFAYQSRPGAVTVPITYQGSALQVGIAYSGAGTTVSVPTNATTASCGQGIRIPVTNDNSAIIVNTTTPFSAVVYIQTTSPMTTATPVQSTPTETKKITFASVLGGVTILGAVLIAVAYCRAK